MVDVVRVEGLKKLDRELKRLPTKVQRQGLRKAVRAGAQVVVKSAKSLAPVGKTGALKRNIKSRRGQPSKNREATETYIVGVEHGRVRRDLVAVFKGSRRRVSRQGKVSFRRLSARERRGEDPFYFKFQELGFTAVGRRKANGRLGRAVRRSRGRKIPGRRFLSTGLRRSAAAATERMRVVLARTVDNYKADG